MLGKDSHFEKALIFMKIISGPTVGPDKKAGFVEILWELHNPAPDPKESLRGNYTGYKGPGPCALYWNFASASQSLGMGCFAQRISGKDQLPLWGRPSEWEALRCGSEVSHIQLWTFYYWSKERPPDTILAWFIFWAEGTLLLKRKTKWELSSDHEHQDSIFNESEPRFLLFCCRLGKGSLG